MEATTAGPLLELDGATVRLGRRDVLRNTRLTLARGEVVGVTGPNGAGKTTLLRLVANVLRPASGRRVGRPTVAYVPAAVEPPLLTVRSWLSGVRRDRRVEPDTVLEQLGFDGALDRPCRELSFGNLRKVLLADAFSSRSELLVFDEVAEGLDSRGAAALVELMLETRARAGAVLFAEQQTRRIAGADRIVVVQHGELAAESSGEGEVTVTLRGPAAALSDLTERAGAVGFRPVTERR